MAHYLQNRNMRLYFTIVLILSTSLFCTAQDVKKDILKDWYGNVAQLGLAGNDTLVLKDAKTNDSTKAFSLRCRYMSGSKFQLFFHDEKSGVIDGLYISERMKWLVRHQKRNYILKIAGSSFKYEYALLPLYDGDILSQIILIRKK